ncbi:aldehyde dehydrogenase family protein [Mycobacterium sp. CBMA293]|uniref:aldehyde dehydrogenase family protein n=1 Tax=unclassified Mycolicibacterium TaxID=2636767 RepID=UPI0012DC65C7|nr:MULTISPECIES: aldehyde dehydrogenase family protein [unclassified Mycolicibacterium]MUL48915.1 aldehyde dehydrogenase family protein [Mycolicibacterium sp. CBMA 360]MUL62527.1 aldehyde dehydrogenase family protein [Mycolicibacterium sp. CBMA 335]MUL74218.1 aldehyde dehydrogenase family protein [Mycolicibacterium sp. CBMA 311]MUL96912.1 aldehyde dehydrogenase family protein [Mycolicibacterium sp. CBMA 230]MUM03960.1 aldehyde dehydrogenase [Mycolicibacterium sp. CBMA 213]
MASSPPHTALTDRSSAATAQAILQRSSWAARAYADFDAAAVSRIVARVVAVAESNAAAYAEWAVRETGFGVVEHKRIKNIACSRGLQDAYADSDFITPRLRPEAKIVEIPRPAGVILALTPTTNPVSSVYFKTILALMTRNAIVICPHPRARECCIHAAHALAEAAVAAGAPDGAVQVIEHPSIPLLNTLMTDARTSVILATGGADMVRSAYRSGNPALGVGPGNVPVLVDRTAELSAAAERIVDSKSFDNSVLCTNESVLIAEQTVSDDLLNQLRRHGAHILQPDERDRIRAMLFPDNHFDSQYVGRSATDIAQAAALRVDPGTKILVAPFDLVVPEEPLAHEKLCPVLGYTTAATADDGIAAARSVLRITGAGHSAAIHSNAAETVLKFSAAVPVYRVSVNVGNSLGGAGFHTNLAPTMTIGTGFFGRSSLGENLEPAHLVHWSRIAYNADATEIFPSFDGLTRSRSVEGATPPYPLPSNDSGDIAAQTLTTDHSENELRAELRRLILEELTDMMRS